MENTSHAKTQYKCNPDAVNVFFASDDNYIPYLEVSLASLFENCDKDTEYDVHILTSGISRGGVREVRRTVGKNIKIIVDDVTEYIEPVKEALGVRLRDYYSDSIYFRLFIASMYPELHRAVYLDSDIVLLDDVAKLLYTDLEGAVLGVVTDESVISTPVFCDYVTSYIGMKRAEDYFNSGVLVMDLDAFREEKILDKFLLLLREYNFPTVAPDQDYLNFLTAGRVKFLGAGWNKHAIPGRDIDKDELHLVHFNMFNKPWHYKGVPYEELFWHYAEKTPSLQVLLDARAGYTDELRARDLEAGGRLLASAEEIYKSETPLYITATEALAKNYAKQ